MSSYTLNFKRIIVVTMCAFLYSFVGHAQVITLSKKLNDFSVANLPAYQTQTKVAQISSYDPTGDNNDGFGGTYSFISRNADSSLVLFDMNGPGVIERIWTPTPTLDTFDFYIDDARKPTLSICYLDLFSGKVAPFVTPLCSHAVGGYYCYFPVLFQHHCKIVCRGKYLQFHQIQYRLYPEHFSVESFKVEKARFAKVDLHADVHGDHMKEGNNVITFDHGARITGLEIYAPELFHSPNEEDSILLYWDDEKIPAVSCPVIDVFGFAFGRPAMKGLLVGADADKQLLYCYLPMPFDRSAKIEIRSRHQYSIHCYYQNLKRNAKKEGRFYSERRKGETIQGEKWLLLDTKVKGHYVGTMLTGESLLKDGTGFFEGDDSTAIDGEFRIHGTGTEDYFNGGWYNIKGKWDTIRCEPLSGCLGYSLKESHTGGYRFYLSDKLSFEKSIYQAIEHGPDINGYPAIYTSVAYYYCDKPKK